MKSFWSFPIARIGFSSLILMVSSLVLAQGDTTGGVGKPLAEVKVRELNKNPGKFAGEQVTITGKVAKIEGPRAFIVEGSGFLNNKILAVVESKPKQESTGQQPGVAAPVVKENQKVQLTGRVEEIGITKIEENYSPLKAEIKAEFEGNMPILIVPSGGIKSVS